MSHDPKKTSKQTLPKEKNRRAAMQKGYLLQGNFLVL